MSLGLSKTTLESKRNWRRTSSWMLLTLLAIGVGSLGFYYVLRMGLSTEFPLFPVVRNNMCASEGNCDGWSHPFGPTLHVGDLIVVQGTEAGSLKSVYPDSEVVVFHLPKQAAYQEDMLVVTRIVFEEEVNGTVYFRTKSDGEGNHKWPEIPETSECENWQNDYRENYTLHSMISERLLVGKVVFRIPWAGHLFVLVQSIGVYILIALATLLVILNREAIGKMRPATKKKRVVERFSET